MPHEMIVDLAANSALEIRMRETLRNLARKYDLSGWMFTDVISIVENGMPHSHPILTIGTTHVGDPLMALAEFLHEQLHWYEEREFERRDRFIEATRIRYPIVPIKRPDGCGDEISTRLHLLVCHLEHRSLETLIGGDAAQTVIRALAKHHYRWVYDTILRDKVAVATLTARHGLTPAPLHAMGA